MAPPPGAAAASGSAQRAGPVGPPPGGGVDAPAIALGQVTKMYERGVRALNGVSATIARGEWVAIMGPSGSGKTTLLNLLDGLDRPTSGQVKVLGVDLARLGADDAATFRREHLGLIFQQFHLIPYLTALENVMLAQYYHSIVDQDQAMSVLDRMKMRDRVHHLPAQLSGGEQQRVCIARALVNEPQIILADEPTGNLDEANERIVLEIFQDLHQRGNTIVVVTHDPEVGEQAQRTILLRHGRIVEKIDEGHRGVLPARASSIRRMG